MAFQAYGDLVQVKRIQEDNSKVGNITVPEKFRQQSDLGTVVSFGRDAFDITVGDVIKFGVYNAENLTDDGEDYLLIRAADIRGIKR